MQGVDATTSGVRSIPLGIAQIVAVVAVGALVTKIGHYVGSGRLNVSNWPKLRLRRYLL